MEEQQKQKYVRLGLAAVLLILCSLAPVERIGRLLLFLIPYFLVGWDVLMKATRNILNGQIFDENFLMSLATVGAFGIGEYPEAVFVMLFYQIGELFQGYAVDRSRRSIAGLMDLCPEFATIEQDGRLVQVDPGEVAVGTVIVVKPGEKIALDGVVLEGFSSLNMAALTGEAAPRDVEPGDDVISGCVNLTGLLRVRVSHCFEDSTVSKILELVENSAENKARMDNFITRFARYYTPVVVIAAACVGFLPPIFLGGWSGWIRKALIFLVVSCPCALVISVPLSFFGGIGGASRRGILIKGSNYLEALAHAEIMVFDKTGTLTEGTFAVAKAIPHDCTAQELLKLAAQAENYSDHPIAVSLKAGYFGTLDTGAVRDTVVLPGKGVRAVVDGQVVHVGNRRLMEEVGIQPEDCQEPGTLVYVAAEGRYLGYILIGDTVKPEAREAIFTLKQLGIRRTIMLSGDSCASVSSVAQQLGLDAAYGDLLPDQKVARVETLLKEKHRSGTLVYVGDGINDAPVLSGADIGIAMGAFGSDAAIEAADVVLMDDKVTSVSTAVRIARKTMGIVKQNIVFSLGVKFLVLLAGVLGAANLWEAVFADVGVCVIAIINAARALNTARL